VSVKFEMAGSGGGICSAGGCRRIGALVRKPQSQAAAKRLKASAISPLHHTFDLIHAEKPAFLPVRRLTDWIESACNFARSCAPLFGSPACRMPDSNIRFV
jgi:hypothetical protein